LTQYQYTTTKEIDGILSTTINLTLLSYTNTQGTYSPLACDPSEFFGEQEVEYEADEDLSWMTREQSREMEEWLFRMHQIALEEEMIDD
jgi:hypothetical protein